MRFLYTPLFAIIFILPACSGPEETPEDCVPEPEQCNGFDDDCDGVTDEDESGGPLRQGCSSECGSGLEECEAGLWVYCTARLPTAEVCDSVDNDCDGDTDEGCECLHGERRDCGIDVGVCEPGVQHCDNGEWRECQLGYDPEDLEEICNDGLDNDCDGDTDEACTCVPGDTQECGTAEGECEAGLMTCQDDSTWDTTCVGEVEAEVDVCDGLDNDCDGESDWVVWSDFGWQADSNEPNNTTEDAAPIYNDSGSLELLEGDPAASPTVGDPSVLTTYPSLYPPGDEDWYYTNAQEVTDCWNPFSEDCAFRLTAQLLLADREYVEGAIQEPEDYRFCIVVGESPESQEFCSHNSDFYPDSNVFQLSIVWGSNCLNTGRRPVRFRVYSPTEMACGYYQLFAWFEFDEEAECPE